MGLGYCDVLLMVKLPGSDIWAEVQFHILEAFLYNDKSHKCYEVLRHLPDSNSIIELVIDNEKVKEKRFRDSAAEVFRKKVSYLITAARFVNAVRGCCKNPKPGSDGKCANAEDGHHHVFKAKPKQGNSSRTEP